MATDTFTATVRKDNTEKYLVLLNALCFNVSRILLKIPTVSRYWVKLTGIFEGENFLNERTIPQWKLQKP